MERPWHAFYPPGLPSRGEYPPLPVWGLLERAAAAHGDRIALVAGGERRTYRALWRRVLEVAGWIRGQGARPGDRVLLQLPNSTAFATAYYGALRAGCIVVPASPAIGATERDRLIADTEPALVVTADPGAGRTPEPVEERIAVLQQTSGTTGRARAAIMSHENLVANALQNLRWFRWSRDEINLAVLPLCHTWGMCVCLNATVAAGGTLILARAFDAEETLRLVAEHGVTVLYGSATMFHRLLDRPRRPLPSLRHVKAGAMLTQGGLKERWDEAYPHAPLQQGYGLTESSPECHNNPPHRFKPGTVGIPIQDTDCRIAADGEILIAGPQVSRGYWNGPAIDGWLHTGDAGRMDDEGYLTIVDRLKDLLKFRGYTVSPNAVEECLLAHPAVREAVLVGRPDERDGDVPAAFVVVDGAVTDEELTAHCAERLARYEVPREIRRVDAIPRNEVGKPLRRVLRDTMLR